MELYKGEVYRLFNLICVETSAKCNRTCVFCPNHANERPDEYMEWSTIETIVKQLSELDYRGRFSPYIYNEPTRDKRLEDICRYVSASLPHCGIMIDTNGDYFKSAEDIERLFRAGVQQIAINIYSQSDQFAVSDRARFERGRALAQKRAAKVQQWLDDLGVDQKGSLYLKAPRSARRARVVHKYGVEPTTKNIGQYQLSNRADNMRWWYQPPEEPLKKMCVRPFRVLNINWRGEAILCCNDYFAKSAFGNVQDTPLLDLWNHVEFNEYRLMLQNKRRDVPICDVCDYKGGSYPHRIAKVSFGSKKDSEILARPRYKRS